MNYLSTSGSVENIGMVEAAEALEFYTALVEDHDVGILAIKQGVIVFANRAFKEILAFAFPNIIGLPFLDIVQPSDRIILSEVFNQFEGGRKEMFSQSFKVNSDSVEEAYISINIKPKATPSPQFDHVVVSRIATKRVTTHLKLEELKKRYELFYRNTIDGVLIYDYANEKVIDANDAVTKILGYTNEDFNKGLNRFDIVPRFSEHWKGIDIHKEIKSHLEIVQKGESFYRPGIFKDKFGEEHLVSLNIIPISNNDQAYVIFTDRTKEILNKKALKRSEKDYRLVFDNSHEGIIYGEYPSFSILMCNAKCLEIFGYDSYEEFCKLDKISLMADPITNGMPTAEYCQFVMDEASEKGISEMKFKALRKDGSTFELEGKVKVDRTDKENPKIISFLRDVTEFNLVQKKIKDKNASLKKYIDSNMELENFAYIASHDLQTPIRSIISFTQLLEKRLGAKLGPIEKEYMDFIVASGHNMKSLINDVLLYSRVNTAEINFVNFNPQNTFELLKIELASVVKEQSATLNFVNIPPNILADQTKFKQLFLNLITNAIKFTRKGVEPSVDIICEELDSKWQFSVVDNGIGIEKEFQEKVFLLFKKLHPIGEYEGTGIGLAMVKKIVEQHDGEIWVESEIEKGTTFYFTINKFLRNV